MFGSPGFLIQEPPVWFGEPLGSISVEELFDLPIHNVLSVSHSIIRLATVLDEATSEETAEKKDVDKNCETIFFPFAHQRWLNSTLWNRTDYQFSTLRFFRKNLFNILSNRNAVTAWTWRNDLNLQLSPTCRFFLVCQGRHYDCSRRCFNTLDSKIESL